MTGAEVKTIQDVKKGDIVNGMLHNSRTRDVYMLAAFVKCGWYVIAYVRMCVHMFALRYAFV